MIDLQGNVAGGVSVLLVGGPGSGRTTVLEELLAHHGDRALRIRGEETVAGTPLAPFAPVLGRYGADLADPLRIYTELALVLAEDASLLVVDDVDALDRGSAVLVAQLHRAGMTVVAAAEAPAAVTGALRETTRRWPVVALPPLEAADLARIAGLALATEAEARGPQGQLLAPSLARLLPVVAGRPGVLVAILEEAHARGVLVDTPAGFALGELPVPDAALVAAGLEVGDLRAYAEPLGRLAVAGDLPEALFEETDVADLARQGVVVADGEVVRLLDPLCQAWALDQLRPELRRRTMLRTAERLREQPGWDERRNLLEACVAVTPERVADVTAAARWLHAHGRLAEAQALVRGVGPQAGTGAEDAFELALVEADLHLASGHASAAVTALDRAEEHLGTGARIDALVERWLTALGGRPDQEQALRERMSRVLAGIDDPGTQEIVRTAWRRRQVIVGFPGAGPALESAHDDPVVVALRESMTGSLEVARTVAAGAETDPGDPAGLDEQLRILAHFLSLVYDGQLVEGRAMAEDHHRRAREQGLPTLGLWTYNLAKIAFHAGQYDQAATRAAEARRHLLWRDVAGQALPAEAMLAASLARLGRLDQALRIVELLTPEDRMLPRVRIGVARVEAEQARQRREHAAAAGLLAAAGRYAVENDEAHSGLLAVDESFMVHPDPAVTELLVGLREKSALVAAFADRAVAVGEKDAAALAAVAERFEAMVQPGRAAHAWSTAARIYEDRRQSEAARRARQHAVRVSTLGQVTPWPTESPDEAVLTAREYQIAVRAAGRQRSREIALALDLSVRTVDNHLARAYRKLGISRRDELAEALDLTR